MEDSTQQVNPILDAQISGSAASVTIPPQVAAVGITEHHEEKDVHSAVAMMQQEVPAIEESGDQVEHPKKSEKVELSDPGFSAVKVTSELKGGLDREGGVRVHYSAPKQDIKTVVEYRIKQKDLIHQQGSESSIASSTGESTKFFNKFVPDWIKSLF